MLCKKGQSLVNRIRITQITQELQNTRRKWGQSIYFFFLKIVAFFHVGVTIS
ncbi:MAG TPA: hypothetical protein P5547_13400 [Spirochaetota bacterium]|nr:hypothetical protein [Spirochaetota bacterium]HRR61921.1 hypothetical protein [Spirochaetota bacterium]